MNTYEAWIKKSLPVLIIAVIFGLTVLSGCVKNPKSKFEDCMKEEGKVNPNYYNAQLKCSNKTGYSPY